MAFDESDFSTGGPWGLFWPGCCCEGQQPPCGLPVCWSVTLDDVSGCTGLEGSWAVPKTGATTWSCTIPNVCTGCGDQTITVSVDLEKGTVTVGAAGKIWSGDYADCQDEFDMSLEGGGDETLSLEPMGGGPCTCSCSIPCTVCGGAGAKLASYVEVVLDGLTEADCCSGCSAANGTYLLPLIGCAVWRKGFWSPSFCPENCESSGIELEFRLSYDSSYGIVATLSIHWYYSSVCTEASGVTYRIRGLEEGPTINCQSFSAGFGVGDVWRNFARCGSGTVPACDVSGASASVTTVGTAA